MLRFIRIRTENQFNIICPWKLHHGSTKILINFNCCLIVSVNVNWSIEYSFYTFSGQSYCIIHFLCVCLWIWAICNTYLFFPCKFTDEMWYLSIKSSNYFPLQHIVIIQNFAYKLCDACNRLKSIYFIIFKWGFYRKI